MRNLRALIAFAVGFLAPLVYAQSHGTSAVVTGPGAADKVLKLIATNPHLRTAVERMEGRGLHSLIESSAIVSGTSSLGNHTSSVPLAHIETAEVAGSGIELIFIPAYYAPGYWEGTVDARRFDAYGHLTYEYIADVVATAPDATSPLDVVDEEPIYDSGAAGGGPDQQMSVDLGRQREIAPHRGGAHAEAWRGKWSAWAKCTAAWCGGALAGCAVVNVISGEVGFIPCATAGCITGALGCTYGTIWD